MGTVFTAAVVATPGPGEEHGPDWPERVRRYEEAGFRTLLVPDTLWTASPFPALAAAAAVTSTMRLRTWVVAAPLRTAAALVREVKTLQQLSRGRFELGIGPGRPDAEGEAARLGMPWGSAGRRIEQVEDAVEAVRAEVVPVPPVAVAAGGPRMLAAAGRLVTGPEDRIALAIGPYATAAELAETVERVRSAAGRSVRLSHQVSALGDAVPRWLAHQGMDAAALRAARSAGWFEDVDHAAAELSERARTLGIDEVVVPAELAEAFAPVLSRLPSGGDDSG
jgi:alkanesulfonate monooxygenase SsuD/methylene tetrahydromethanopterin reductase-like flavin-dependent oxidoreductase (luciferase family)